jgi:hypothetical protein
MTAKEIRNTNWISGVETLAIAEFLQEIAAQLADLNELFKGTVSEDGCSLDVSFLPK